MTVIFFEKEVNKAQSRFNGIFGNEIVCNIEARDAAIFTICQMGVICKKLKKSKEKEFIQEFVRLKNIINTFFNRLEKENEERRRLINEDSNGRNKDEARTISESSRG